MESRPEYFAIWLGLSRLGVVTSLLNYNLKQNSLSHCINVSNCKGLVFGGELTSSIQELADSGGRKSHLQLYSIDDRNNNKLKLTCNYINLSQELENIKTVDVAENFAAVNNNDVAFYIFTSGTTGLPKAAKMRHTRIFTYGAVAYPLCMDAERDVVLTPIPLYHVQGGLLGSTCALFHGVPQVIVRKFSASQFWRQCIKYDVTYCQFLGEIIR
jgi:solute carrier family 27 fatty acid transporter 1/4